MLENSQLREMYSEGYSWDDYLLLVNKSANLHQKRYDEIQNVELADIKLPPNLKAIIITEEGCGDCAWAVPKLIHLLNNLQTVEYKLFPRREFPEIQDSFLTKGKRSVPKLVIVDQGFNVVGQWGPRPSEIQAYVEKSVGVIERTIWFPKVLAYYRSEEGQTSLINEVGQMLNSI